MQLPATLAEPVERLWLRTLRRLARDYVWIERDDMYLFGARGHRKTLYRMARGSYERFTTELFTSALRPGMIVLDIGAWVGHFALQAGRVVGPEGHVYAFECHPVTYRFLRHNIVVNGQRDVVTAIPRAVSDRAGVVPFFLHGGDTMRSSLWRDERGKVKRTIEVESSAIDDMLGDRDVDVIKLDIEGGEIQALRGMSRTLERAGRLVMFVECNPSALAAAGSSVAGLLERLHGFDVRVIHETARALSDDLGELYEAERSADRKYFVNLYCTKGL